MQLSSAQYIETKALHLQCFALMSSHIGPL